MTQSQEEKYKAKLAEYLPETSVDAIYDFMIDHKVQLRITRERLSKLGDYRHPTPESPNHEISINGDLGKSFFLWVLLHEMGHLTCWNKYHGTVKGHGHEWQQEYRTHIAQHYLLGSFDKEVMSLIAKYVKRIPLNHSIGNKIEEYFRRIESADDQVQLVLLNDLNVGDRFVLTSRPGQVFVAVEKRRTRWKCHCENDRKDYLVNGGASVEVLH